mgnify:CR=1 FL=1
MLALARDPAAWQRFVDEERGLVVVEYFTDPTGRDPRRDAGGTVATAEHHCGEDLEAQTLRLQELLALHVTHGDARPAFSCSDDRCQMSAAMEFGLNREFVFVADGPRVVLDHIVSVETAMTEPFYARADAFSRGELARLADAGCTKG